MELELRGRRALVTAGAAGIGRRIAEVFADAGAAVHVCDVDAAALGALAAARPGIGTTVADVADPAAVDRLFEAAGTRLGGLDILVNNAGIAGPTGRIEDIEPHDVERVMQVNVLSMFYCARRAVPLLKAAGGGAIVNLSSVAGRLGFPLRAPYAASKFAVVGFTETLAMELGPDGIRVNAILPGPVEGPRIDRVIAAKAAARGIAEPEMRAEMTRDVSLRRFVTADDIAATALFVCSEAGRNVSGQALSVCGNVERIG